MAKSTFDCELQQKISEWLVWDQNEKTRNEIQQLADAGNGKELQKLLLNRLAFGTAGLRGRMGPGYSQMNDLVLIQTSQGLATYLLEQGPADAKKGGVVIGYDGRHNSRRFAELTAGVFLNRGIPVYLFSQVCPTPFVPFAVLQFKCIAGVMVTASHNPKHDNGYKVYWSNGAQIISPHDKGIQESILNNLCPWETSWDTSILSKSSLLKDPLCHVMKMYYDILSNDVLFPNVNANTPIKFTYTAMHGVGYPYMVEAFEVAKFKPFVSVTKQQDPDPEFSTVEFPNPEEGKSSLDLSFKTADNNDSTIIIANDPDADRLAVAEKNESTKEWHVFSGNELGALLGWWCFHCYMKKHPDVDVKDIYLLASTVSSQILGSIAKVEGFNFVETLTGFKWMGNKAYDLMKEGKKVLFAFEEAIGFMYGTAVLDKDGVSAAVHLAELTAQLETEGKTLMDKLQEIYSKYGFHISENSYYLCYEPEVICQMFKRLRNYSGKPNTYPTSILGGRYEVVSVRDLTTGYDSSQPDEKAVLPVSKSSQMITFKFNNGLVATFRTSGTEPKIKYYTELCASPDQKDVEELKSNLHEMVVAMVNDFMEPEKNRLTPKSS
ncbi:phosphoglucomutase-2 [Ischnura elegans]|uniref:phosphoglucomutase-2 n=1 Tax=Ischnura elegans TaxID=197161 RepID=UPI001ED8A0FA|nr:phosphoglucomutase-2 [Ischnura elegans]XP_046388516.1 phosphoglucomutase-2 [Ischnura elegans]XP_046388517.1 phosphoglucomutase-2 [Ischnura elegans]